MNSLKASTASGGVDMVRVNACWETRTMTHDQECGGDQSHCYSSLEALPISDAGGSQQALRIKWNADHWQRCRARHKQAEEAAAAICASGTKSKSHQTRISVLERGLNPAFLNRRLRPASNRRVSQCQGVRSMFHCQDARPASNVLLCQNANVRIVFNWGLRQHGRSASSLQRSRRMLNLKAFTPTSLRLILQIPLQWIWGTTW